VSDFAPKDVSMTQRLDADEFYAPIVAPEVVHDGPPRRTT
jgi:hypothetical protein